MKSGLRMDCLSGRNGARATLQSRGGIELKSAPQEKILRGFAGNAIAMAL